MIGSHLRGLWVVALATLIMILTSCGRACSPKPKQGDLDQMSASEAIFMNQPVQFCWERAIQPRQGKVQVLVDGSGSMVGFEKATAPLVTWVQQGISQLQNSTLQITSSRICQFSEGRGVYSCADFSRQPAGYDFRGNTNLHEAIRSAEDYELTFIITDGVAATGDRSAGDCAEGVDASCVARALQSFVNPKTATREDVSRGIWIVPIAANYSGKFYTEEPIVPSDFESRNTIDQIRSDLGIEAVVQDPRTESDGLVFTYQGPRALLLIVLARPAEVGRAAVQAVWERASLNSIEQLKQMKGQSRSLGILEPIEIYPGFLNPVQWQSLQESDDPAERRGTMDAFYSGGAAKPTISVSCPKSGSGEGVYTLSGSDKASGRVSGCVPIHILPAFAFKIRPVRGEGESDLSQILKGVERKGDSYSQLRLHLSCIPGLPYICGQNSIAAHWMVYMNYSKAADGLAAPKGEYFLQQQIKQLSTEHPSREPHRVYAFLQTLETFYREVSQDQRSFVLGSIDFCFKD